MRDQISPYLDVLFPLQPCVLPLLFLFDASSSFRGYDPSDDYSVVPFERPSSLRRISPISSAKRRKKDKQVNLYFLSKLGLRVYDMKKVGLKKILLFERTFEVMKVDLIQLSHIIHQS